MYNSGDYGTKINPLGFRWVQPKVIIPFGFTTQKLFEVYKKIKIRDCIKNYVQKNMRTSSGIEELLIIFMGFPKLLIESRQRGIEELQMTLQKEFNCVNRKRTFFNRVTYRKAMKKAIELTEQADTKGIQKQIAAGFLQTIRAKIDYCSYTVRTIYGILGIKIWIFLDEE
ncbi:hypothetical protein R3W88_016355 [Solanum pinnatisectum]|uniref:Ribosomal protein S3 n=1 Tax=Solanum pinnatisectum TaxID=50273 RepID=A0AAV9L1D7_9SOLN|nr:hypothetical protein R3W88_016355 [Solanum pinnatisectum]